MSLVSRILSFIEIGFRNRSGSLTSASHDFTTSPSPVKAKGDSDCVVELELLAKEKGLAAIPDLAQALSHPSPLVADTSRFLLISMGWKPSSDTELTTWTNTCPYNKVVMAEAGISRTFLVEQKNHRYCSLNNAVFESGLEASDRWEAIPKMINAIFNGSGLSNDEIRSIQAHIEKRETSMTTGIGFNIAVPHASSHLVTNLKIGWFQTPSGVNFQALDNKPVYLVVCFVVPQGQFQKHMHSLAEISILLHRAEVRDACKHARSHEELRLHIVRALYKYHVS